MSKVTRVTMQELLEKGRVALLPAPKQSALYLPLEDCYASADFWADLKRYVSASLWRQLRVAYRSDATLQTDRDASGKLPERIDRTNSPSSYKHATYERHIQPEDVEDIVQDAIAKTLENWADWTAKVTEEYGEETQGIHLARYVARRALYLHYNAQAKLQRQGLLGPDFWHTVPETRTESDLSLLLHRIAWEETTDAQCMTLLQHIAEGYTHSEACQALGVTPKTGRRWLNSLKDALENPSFEVAESSTCPDAVVSRDGARTIVTTAARAKARRIAQDAHRDPCQCSGITPHAETLYAQYKRLQSDFLNASRS